MKGASQKPATDPKKEFVHYLKQRFSEFSSGIVDTFDALAGEEIVRLGWILKGKGEKTFTLKVAEQKGNTNEVTLEATLNDVSAEVNLSSFFWRNGSDSADSGFQFTVDQEKIIVVNMFRQSHLRVKQVGDATMEVILNQDDPQSIGVRGLPDFGEFARSYFDNADGPSPFYDHITPKEAAFYKADVVDLVYKGRNSWTFSPVKFHARKLEGENFDIGEGFSIGEETQLSFEQLIVRLLLIHLAVRIPLLLYARANLNSTKS